MAADYWASSHHKKWIIDRLTLYSSRLEDLRFTNTETLAFLNIFFANLISKLGKKLGFRQRVIATATVFFRRFYVKNSFCDTEPYIVLVACCYVAGKAEELPAHIKNVIQVANAIFHDLGVWTAPLDNHRLAEMEFYLVDELECDLTVFHPYRSLVTLVGKETEEVTARDTMAEGTAMPTALHGGGQDMEIDGIKGESGERYWGTGMGKLLLDDKTLQLAWLIINDTYRTDVCLLYPPFMIAIASIYLSLVNHERVSPEALESSPKTQNQTETPAMETSPAAATPKPTNNPEPITFLANLNVDLATVASIAQEMLSFYTLSSRYLDDSGPNVAGSTSNNGNGRAKAESGVDAFFMDIDSKGSGTESPRVEKVRAKQLVEELRRMRTAKLGELDGAALGLTTSGLPGPSHVPISPITSTSTVSSGLKGTRAGQPVNKRLERAQAIG